MATNSAFAVGDLFTAAEALPARYQDKAAWMLNLVHLHDVMEFGNTNFYTRSGTLETGPTGDLLGKPVYECSQFTSTLDGDTNDSIVYGDWDGYVIADRVGASVEFISHLFHTSNNRPSGQRGFFYHWRVGAEVVANTNFVLLYNPST